MRLDNRHRLKIHWHRNKLAEIAASVVMSLVLLFASSVDMRAFAAIGCPEGMSQVDCDALYGDWTDWVPDACNTYQTDSFSYGAWDPLTLTYPFIPQERMAADNPQSILPRTQLYVKTYFSDSPFAANPQYIDQIYTLSKQRNVNPFLVMAIAKQENGFGRDNSSATANNNYFGVKIDAVNYRSFPTVEAGIDWFVEYVSRRIANPAGTPYEGVANFYEYLSVHQIGMIAYPGEYPDKAIGAPYLTYDQSMRVYTSWQTGVNGNRGDYNPGLYYKSAIELVNFITLLSLSTYPAKGTGTCGTALGAGLVDSQGYSFPLAPQTKRRYGNLPCVGVYTCHHDGTPAFDLSYGDVPGKPVYAILKGQIILFSTWGGTCQSVQLLGDDGYRYWYGHITKVPDFIKVNSLPQPVVAGQQIGVVDTWSGSNTCNGTSGGSHLHIDRGRKGLMGGFQGNRDPEFVPLLQAIYNRLQS